MLADYDLLHDLEQHAFSTTREPMALYGDPPIPYVSTSESLTEVPE